jgi:hypothetical protein
MARLTSDLSQIDSSQIQQRVASRAAASSWRRRHSALQALQRACELVGAVPGRVWPLGRLREAWVVYRYGTQIRDDWIIPDSGPERVGDHAAGDALSRAAALRCHGDRAYEQHADHRPPGWPRAGAAALCALRGAAARTPSKATSPACSCSPRTCAPAPASTTLSDAPGWRDGPRTARVRCRVSAVVPLVGACAMGNCRATTPMAARRAAAHGRRSVHVDDRPAALAHRVDLRHAAELVDGDVDQELLGLSAGDSALSCSRHKDGDRVVRAAQSAAPSDAGLPGVDS